MKTLNLKYALKSLLVLTTVASIAIFTGCAPKNFESLDEASLSEPTTNPASPEAQEVLDNEQSSSSASPLPGSSDLPIEDISDAFSEDVLPAEFSHLDPKKLIPRALLKKTLQFFTDYRSKFKNQRYLAALDFSQRSTNRRLYLVNLQSGAVETFLVAHGKNSDLNHDGYAESFSNKSGSNQSSIGAYMVAETYQGKHGYSVRLDGLQPTNSLARARAVVIHPADYVSSKLNPIGRSWGCPALEPALSRRVIDALKGGSLLYTAK